MCADLMDKGESPICVRACPMHAIEVGDFSELKRNHPGAEELSFEKYPYAYANQVSPNTSTGPSLLIKPRKRFRAEN
jgi:Fe-S-cluster-containing dehydrogenase component